jgi:hypothetical protein
MPGPDRQEQVRVKSFLNNGLSQNEDENIAQPAHCDDSEMILSTCK